jgi:hypothetical protein
MDWGDYLRDEAAKYRQLAETAKELLPCATFARWVFDQARTISS